MRQRLLSPGCAPRTALDFRKERYSWAAPQPLLFSFQFNSRVSPSSPDWKLTWDAPASTPWVLESEVALPLPSFVYFVSQLVILTGIQIASLCPFDLSASLSEWHSLCPGRITLHFLPPKSSACQEAWFLLEAGCLETDSWVCSLLLSCLGKRMPAFQKKFSELGLVTCANNPWGF